MPRCARENEMTLWAHEAPRDLLAFLRDPEADYVSLKFGAEIAARELNPDLVVPILIGLLQHESALVREGALIGLGQTNQMHSNKVRSEVVRISAQDPSSVVRGYATWLLAQASQAPPDTWRADPPTVDEVRAAVDAHGIAVWWWTCRKTSPVPQPLQFAVDAFHEDALLYRDMRNGWMPFSGFSEAACDRWMPCNPPPWKNRV